MGEFIQGERLLLSLPTFKDEEENDYCDNVLLRILSDQETLKHLRILYKNWTLDEIKERRISFTQKNLKEEAFYLHIFFKSKSFESFERFSDKGILIGTTGFREIHIHQEKGKNWGEFGIVISKEFWRLGISAESHFLCLNFAFDKLSLDFVIFSTLEENIPMNKFFEKFKIPFQKMNFIHGQEWKVFQLDSDWWFNEVKILFEKELNKMKL
jgi:RimJ/RimL family protein N-acetyltransferase